ncbi:hypothetical protein PAXRUDRAFT_595422, partial [Paxillus rubicundulus Ve08.2h10]
HDQASVAQDLHRQGRSNSNGDIPGRGPRIPQQRYTTSSKRTFTPADGRLNRILFNLENPSEIGIPIIDLLNWTDTIGRLQDRSEALNDIGGTGNQTFSLRISWPGYVSFERIISTHNWKKVRSPVTRDKLGESIARAVKAMLDRFDKTPCHADYASWHVGPDGIRLQDIVLVAMHLVSKGSWQPELCLSHPHR